MNIQSIQLKLPYILLLCILAVLPLSKAHAVVAKEYHVKAVFLYNFANFVLWPDESFKDSNTAYEICIFGEDPFERIINLAVENHRANNRPLDVKRPRNLIDIMGCHILFISESEEERLDAIFSFTEKYPILTVSDIPDFVIRGGIIRFFSRNNKIRLEIRPSIAESVGLKIDANLLNLADVFEEKERE